MVTDGLGNPLKFMLSSGNRNDIKFAQKLLEPFDLQGKLILADRGYDSQELVDWIEERGGIVIIPSRITNRVQREIDRDEYNERHLVENLFLKLKHNRRFATRYEKKAIFFRAVTALVCVLVWLS
jgi:transposase